MSAIASARHVDFVSLDQALALGAAQWARLQGDGSISSPFGTWAWYRAWADAAPAPERAASGALIGWDDAGRPGAVFPIRLSRTRFRRVPVTALTWAVGELGCPDHLDLPALPDADLDALVAGVERLPWDVILLDNVAEEAPNVARLRAALEARGWPVAWSARWRCPYLTLPSSWDAYLATLTPTRRQTVRRKERNLYRDHDATLTDYAPDRFQDGWRVLTDLHARRWDGAAALGAPGMEPLHLGLNALLPPEATWLVSLDLDGTPAAAWYGFALGDTVSFYQGGWDPRWERQSVGAVLMGMMIRRAIERGFRTFDFLRGEEPYKATWTQAARTCYRLSAIRPGWRGAALRMLDGLARRRARMVHV